jgi:hypothetical protein
VRLEQKVILETQVLRARKVSKVSKATQGIQDLQALQELLALQAQRATLATQEQQALRASKASKVSKVRQARPEPQARLAQQVRQELVYQSAAPLVRFSLRLTAPTTTRNG